MRQVKPSCRANAGCRLTAAPPDDNKRRARSTSHPHHRRRRLHRIAPHRAPAWPRRTRRCDRRFLHRLTSQPGRRRRRSEPHGGRKHRHRLRVAWLASRRVGLRVSPRCRGRGGPRRAVADPHHRDQSQGHRGHPRGSRAQPHANAAAVQFRGVRQKLARRVCGNRRPAHRPSDAWALELRLLKIDG